MDMKNQSACNFLFGSDKKFTAEDVFGGEREFASDERLKSFPVSFLTGNTEYLPRTWLRL